jgi:hypothetical protein
VLSNLECVEFVPMAADEARSWLRARGQQEVDPTPKHLADLFARVEARELDGWKAFGFGASF